MNDYATTGPALISFSGGRTSAYMLHEIVRAHGGTLPADVIVGFANTGKERDETLRFVQRCAAAWGVHVNWVEASGPTTFEAASRQGEPFDALIERKKFLPNSAMRFCTQELKVKPLHDLASRLLGASYTEVIGLRYDEVRRYGKMVGRNLDEGRQCVAPLFSARITERDVLAFWKAQPFDLGLSPGEGNCDLCFLKGAGLLRSLIRENPDAADWWVAHEERRGAQFTKRDSYAQMRSDAAKNGDLFEIEEHDVECGLLCEP